MIDVALTAIGIFAGIAAIYWIVASIRSRRFREDLVGPFIALELGWQMVRYALHGGGILGAWFYRGEAWVALVFGAAVVASCAALKRRVPSATEFGILACASLGVVALVAAVQPVLADLFAAASMAFAVLSLLALLRMPSRTHASSR